jgi:hypothetical protein
MVESAGPSSVAPLTGFAGPAFGSTEFNPGDCFEPVPRACKHADFLV